MTLLKIGHTHALAPTVLLLDRASIDIDSTSWFVRNAIELSCRGDLS